MNIGTLTASLVLNTSKFNAPLMDAQAKLKQLAIKTRTLSRDMANAGMRLSLFVTAPIVGMGVAAVKAASAATETKQRFDVVFAGLEQQAGSAAQSIARNWDLAMQSTQGYLADAASFFQGMGFGREESLRLSKSVVGLAGDLTSFLDLADGVDGAMKRMISAMAGNSRAARELRVNYTQGEAKFESLKAKIKATTGVTDTQARALTVLKFAFNQSKNALGDYARTADSTANRVRALGEAWKDLKVTIGDFLIKTLKLPQMLKTAADGLRKFGNWFQRLPMTVKKFALYMALAAASLGPLLLGLSTLFFTFTMFLTSGQWVLAIMVKLIAVFGFLTSPMGLVTAALVTSIAAFLRLAIGAERFHAAIAQLPGLLKAFSAGVVKTIVRLVPRVLGFFANFTENVKILTTWLASEWKNAMYNLGVITGYGLDVIVFTISAWMASSGRNLFWGLVDGALTAFMKIGEYARMFIDGLDDFFGASTFVAEFILLFDKLKTQIAAALKNLIGIAGVYMQAFWDSFSMNSKTVKKTIDDRIKVLNQGYSEAFAAAEQEHTTKLAMLLQQNDKSGLSKLLARLAADWEAGKLAGQTGKPLGQIIADRIKDTWPDVAKQLRNMSLPDLKLALAKLTEQPVFKQRALQPSLPGGGMGGASVSKTAPAAVFGSMEAFKISNNAQAIQKKIEKNTAEVATNTKILIHATEYAPIREF